MPFVFQRSGLIFLREPVSSIIFSYKSFIDIDPYKSIPTLSVTETMHADFNGNLVFLNLHVDFISKGYIRFLPLHSDIIR